MQTEIKEVGPCKLSVKVGIPKETIKKKLDEKYKDFIENTVIPGFRKGHAPQGLVERKFGKAIREDTKMEIISESYSTILKEKNLTPAVEPVIDTEKLTLDEKTELSFEFTMEIAPTINLEKAKYKGVHAKKVKVEVTDKDIKDALEKLQHSSREYVPTEKDVKMKEGDVVIIDQEMLSEGKTVEKRENVELIYGPEINVFGKPSKEIMGALSGMKLNDTKEISLAVPADFQKKDLSGKPVTLKITLKDHKMMKLPEVTDSWAKEMGLESLDALKKELEKGIRAEKERLADRKTEEEIIEEIYKSMDFALPETLVERGAEYMQKRQAMLMAYQGMPEHEVKEHIEKNKTANRETVIKDLKIHYIIEHIAKQEKIFVTENDMKERINEIAARNRKWPNEVQAYYEKNDMMGQLRNELREEKVRKFLRESAKLTD
ncbi:MAG: trigger factor [Planctomycetes bacterium]|nr:trigger factor [Planctomycetota bacterium]